MRVRLFAFPHFLNADRGCAKSVKKGMKIIDLNLLVNISVYAPSEMANKCGGTSLRLLPLYICTTRLV
jgi:hypothetical protein